RAAVGAWVRATASTGTSPTSFTAAAAPTLSASPSAAELTMPVTSRSITPPLTWNASTAASVPRCSQSPRSLRVVVVDPGGAHGDQPDTALGAGGEVVAGALRRQPVRRAVHGLHRRHHQPVAHRHRADPTRLQQVGEPAGHRYRSSSV